MLLLVTASALLLAALALFLKRRYQVNVDAGNRPCSTQGVAFSQKSSP
jgi:hypothetical protein